MAHPVFQAAMKFCALPESGVTPASTPQAPSTTNHAVSDVSTGGATSALPLSRTPSPGPRSPLLASPPSEAVMTTTSIEDMYTSEGPGYTELLPQRSSEHGCGGVNLHTSQGTSRTTTSQGCLESRLPHAPTSVAWASLSPSSIYSPPVSTHAVPDEGSPNHRRNLQRRQRNEYRRNQRGPNGTAPKTLIPTDIDGNVSALKAVLHRAIRDVAGRVLDVTVTEFSQHSPMAFQLIEHDIHGLFVFDPPLREGYIRSYLQASLSWSRYQWRKFWINQKKRHPSCPIKRYPTLVAQWSSDAGILESERMTAIRGRRRRHSNISRTPHCTSTVSEGMDVLDSDEEVKPTALLLVVMWMLCFVITL